MVGNGRAVVWAGWRRSGKDERACVGGTKRSGRNVFRVVLWVGGSIYEARRS